MLKLARIAILQLLVFTVLTGVIYPVAVTVVAQVVFSHAANGSIIERDGKKLGSSLIGQQFEDPKHFWGRPSATGPFPYNGLASSGSNLGPTNPALTAAVRDRVAKYQAADPQNKSRIPVDLVTASGSGLDPQISLAGAMYQLPRVARLRGLPEDELKKVVERHTSAPTLGILGQPRVNVLELNLALDSNATK
jgi:potassium-transporting ATPase KdpC subunit